MAQSDYILSLDADEELSSELRQEILHLKPNLSGVFSLNRLTNYCGTWIHHSSWFPDYQMRLFPRKLGQWNKSFVHEHLVFSEPLQINKLKGLLFHYSIPSLEQHILTVNRYTSLAAERLVEANGSFFLFKAATRPMFHFLKCYFLRFGFLDGFHGFCIAGISSFYVF
ncbi:MAG: glycosyltransferase family 2 protein [Bdellovibrionales bacterium]|nr:glycosyltransferase family 2 protein [Bdellovibrionales bacterium]